MTRATYIAITGPAQSGKTVYTAVLAQTLQMFGSRIGLAGEPADDLTLRFVKNSRDIVYSKRRLDIPEPTRSLIFRFGKGKDRKYLVLRVVSELHELHDVEPPEQPVQQQFTLFDRADGIIYVYDPLRLGRVANQFKDEFDELPWRVNAWDLLRSVLSEIKTGRPRIAIVVSKFDLFHEIRHRNDSELRLIMSNPGAVFARDPSLATATYDNDDGALVDEEVRSLLAVVEGVSIEALTARITPQSGAELESRYFAVSSLGRPPHHGLVHPSGIVPFRCVDPVRWIMDRPAAPAPRAQGSMGTRTY